MSKPLRFAVLLAMVNDVHAAPILTSWFTVNSSKLARVIQTNGAAARTTWPAGVVNNNSTNATSTNLPASQYLPAYSDVQRIRYSATNVYINSSGLASYTMGPWYTGGGGLFGFWPLSQNYTVRITRNPSPATTPKPAHGGGMIGMMVNGVAIYDLGDAFSFQQTANSPAVTGSDAMGANGYWYRDALAVEVVTFDPGFAHQPGANGQYHYHAEPKALRYQLGDNMDATYNSTNKTYAYTEKTNSVDLAHSPILGWAFDGYPIYGPYGYSNPTNPASAVSRMRSGFVLRTGQSGTTDLNSTGRTTLPRWAAAAQSYSNPGHVNPVPLNATEYGPATSYQTSGPGGTTVYSLGRYSGDYDYLGDLTNSVTHTNYQQGTDFDLDQYNGRQCVTPEFPDPAGTYAYFVAIDGAGNPTFPYMLGKQYYGTKNGTSQNVTIPGTGVTEFFNGGTNLHETMKTFSVNNPSGNVTLTWSSVEGGTYLLEASTNPVSTNWITLATVPAGTNAIQTTAVDVGAAATNNFRFYRVARTGVAAFTP